MTVKPEVATRMDRYENTGRFTKTRAGNSKIVFTETGFQVIAVTGVEVNLKSVGIMADDNDGGFSGLVDIRMFGKDLVV